MTTYIKIDYTNNFSSICFSEKEVIEGCGYDATEITLEELCKKVVGEYEIIKVEGDAVLRFYEYGLTDDGE